MKLWKVKDYLLMIVIVILVVLAVAALVGVILYPLYWSTLQYMKIFELLTGTGNGWYYIYFAIGGFALSFMNIPVFSMGRNDKVCVNLGGCALPVALCIYLMYTHFSLVWTFSFAIALTVTTLFSRLFSWYMEGHGVLIMAIGVSLIAAALAHFLAPTLLAKLLYCYIAGTIGPLIGADILHLSAIARDGSWSKNMSIGGAGTKDGIWSIGLAAMFILFWLGW